MKKLIILMLILIFIAGCGKEYVCSDGSIVSDISLCEEEVEEPEEEELQEEIQEVQEEIIQEPEQETVEENILLVSQVQRYVDSVYRKDCFFDKNTVGYNKGYTATDLTYLDIYDSTHTTLLEITDKNEYVLYSSVLGKFVKSFEDSKTLRSEDDIIGAMVEDPEYDEYELYFRDSLNYVKEDITQYSYWYKIYKLADKGGSAEKELFEPYVKTALYVRCSPNIIAAVYPNDVFFFDTVWPGVEKEYDIMVQDRIATERNDALEEAKKLLELCREGR